MVVLRQLGPVVLDFQNRFRPVLDLELCWLIASYVNSPIYNGFYDMHALSSQNDHRKIIHIPLQVKKGSPTDATGVMDKWEKE